MATRTRRGAASSEVSRENGRGGEGPSRKTIETIKDATGASEEDIMVMLQECNNDVNETTSRLIDNPFSQVLGKKDKKKKREEERKKDGSKVIEVRRQPNTGQGGDRRNRDRGPRTSIDRNGHDRSAGRGKPQPARQEEELPSPAVLESEPVASEEPKSAPVPEPSSQRTSYSRAPGPSGSSTPAPAANVWGGKKNWADMLKQPQAPATTLPPSGSLQAPLPDAPQNVSVAPDHQLADLSLADPAVSAPQRISSNAAAETSLSTTQDVQVQGPSPRHPQMSSSLGIGPVVQPPRYGSTENAAPAPSANAWGKPKAAASPIVGPQSGQSAGTSLLSSALGGGSSSMGFSAAPAPIAPPAASASSNISSADPQVTSSGLLSSGMGNSFSHRNDLKAPEPAVLSHQEHDATNQGLQFGQPGGLGQSGILSNLAFGNFGSENQGPVDVVTSQQPSELEHQPSSQHVGSAPSNQDFLQGMGAFKSPLNFSTQPVHQPAGSKAPAAAPAAPSHQQETSTSQQYYGSSGFQAPASQPEYSSYQAPAIQPTYSSFQAPASQPAYASQQAAPSSQAFSYNLSSAPSGGAASQTSYGGFAPQSSYQQPQTHAQSSYQQPQAQTQSSYQQPQAQAQAPAHQAYSRYGQQAAQNSQYAMPAATEPAAPAVPSGPEPSQASSYEDTTGYSNYNQASTFQDYQLPQQPKPQQHQPAAPAQPKYSAAANVAPQQLPTAAPHAGYNAGYGHGSSAYGSTASPAPSTTAPLSGGSNQGAFGASQAAQQQQAPAYNANMGYGHPSQYYNNVPGYGMNSGYGGGFQQPTTGYSGYGASYGGQGAASGFGTGYGQSQSSKYPGGGYSQAGMGYAPQRGVRGGYPANGYDDPSTTGGYGHASKERDAAYSQQAPSAYGAHAHGAGAPPYQGGRDGGYGGYAQSSQGQYGGYGNANQGYGGYGQGYGGYGQSGQGYAQNGPNQTGGFGKPG